MIVRVAFLWTSVKLRSQNTIFINDITERTNYLSSPIELIDTEERLGTRLALTISKLKKT